MLTSQESALDLQKTATNLRQDDADIQFPLAGLSQNLSKRFHEPSTVPQEFRVELVFPPPYFEGFFYVQILTSLIQ